ncbi:MAG: carboxylesterase family protein [Gammaproteobacteria bacterium]|nr:carboxylesterase family protein [Gammaproteobacteria bacterium]
MKRRKFMMTAGTTALAGLASARPSHAVRTGTMSTEGRSLVEIQTRSGRVRGKQLGEVAVFKGIPYAASPIGTLRFQAPKPVKRWSGIRDAFEFGPAAIQTTGGVVSWLYTEPPAMSEDCLTLNIWAPASDTPRPVIVWIHGGGYRTGASSMPLFDGSKFAEIGKVVMVTINYRLGILGWAAHPDLRDPDTGTFANWAIQDQIEALRWIKENVAAFGGDPERITVMGQSGGAINGVMIAHGSIEQPLFHQIIVMSAPYICPPATLNLTDWGTVMEALAHELGTTVAGLRSVPAKDLHNAELQQYQQHSIRTDSGRAYRGTVVDGIVLDEWPAFYALPKMPTIIGCTSMEGASRFNFFDPVSNTLLAPPPPDDAAIRAEIQDRMNALYYLGDNMPTADDVVAHYRASAKAEGRSDDMATVAMELFGDMGGRHYAVRKAEQAVLDGHQGLYFYQYGLPLNPPNHAPAHATELSIVFGTFLHPHYRAKVGDGAIQRGVSAAIIESFAAFAATGRPSSALLPEWPHFQAPGANVMVLGEANTVGRVADLPKYRQLSILDKPASLRP